MHIIDRLNYLRMKSRKNSASIEKKQRNKSNSSTTCKKSFEEDLSRDEEYG